MLVPAATAFHIKPRHLITHLFISCTLHPSNLYTRPTLIAVYCCGNLANHRWGPTSTRNNRYELYPQDNYHLFLSVPKNEQVTAYTAPQANEIASCDKNLLFYVQIASHNTRRPSPDPDFLSLSLSSHCSGLLTLSPSLGV